MLLRHWSVEFYDSMLMIQQFGFDMAEYRNAVYFRCQIMDIGEILEPAKVNEVTESVEGSYPTLNPKFWDRLIKRQLPGMEGLGRE